MELSPVMGEGESIWTTGKERILQMFHGWLLIIFIHFNNKSAYAEVCEISDYYVMGNIQIIAN